MKHNHTTTTTAINWAELDNRTADLYATAEKAVYIALRARHEKSSLQFIEDLQNAQNTDRKARANTEVAEQITAIENELHGTKDLDGNITDEGLYNRLKDLISTQATADRKSKSIKTAEDDRKAWATYGKTLDEQITLLKATINRKNTELNTLYKRLETAYTDRADLTQTAIIQILNNETDPAEITDKVIENYLKKLNKTSSVFITQEDLTEEDWDKLQDTANFRAVINAVGRAINRLATPQAMNRTTTKAVKIEDLTEVEDFKKQYGGIGAEYKAPHTTRRASASDCYITIEERHTKTQNGYYKIYHYKTVAPYQYIEDFTTEDEDGETDIAYLKSYNPFVNDLADLDRIEELMQRANLNNRQRDFLKHFTSRCRYDGNFKAVKDYAFTQLGIMTETNRTTFFYRLKKALNEGYKATYNPDHIKPTKTNKDGKQIYHSTITNGNYTLKD